MSAPRIVMASLIVCSILLLAALGLVSPATGAPTPGHLPVWEEGFGWSYEVDHDVNYDISGLIQVNHIKENWTRTVYKVVDIGDETYYRVMEQRRGTLSGTVKYGTFTFPVTATANGNGWTVVRASDLSLVNQTFNLTFSAQLPLGLGTFTGGFDNVTTYDPPVPMAVFPITPGPWRVVTWVNTSTEFYVSSPYHNQTFYDTQELWDINVTATGPAPTTVPAGTYDAFALREVGTRANATESWPVDRTWYYADEALNFVRTFEGHVMVWTDAVYTPPNEPPAGPGATVELSTPEDTVLSIDVGQYFSDPDGDDLTLGLELAGGSAANATLVKAGDGWDLTPSGDWNGFLDLGAIAMDPFGQTATTDLVVTVTPVNDAPHKVGTVPNLRIDEDTPSYGVIDVADYFDDVDGDALGYTAVGDAGADAYINGTMLDLVPWTDFTGFLQVVLTATDPGSLQAIQTANVEVGQVNDPPTIVGSGGPARVHETEEGTFWVEAEDVENGELTYTWFVDGAEQMSVHGTTFVYAPGDVGGSTVEVQVVVEDGWGASDTASWTVTVLDSPKITGASPASPVNALVGDTVLFSVDVMDADTPQPTIRWTWGGDPAGTDLDLSLLFGSGDVGVGVLRVEVSDGVGNDSHSWEITVAVPNHPPTVEITSPSNGSSWHVGDVVTLNASAGDEDGDALTIRWSVDGSPIGTGATQFYTPTRDGVLVLGVSVSDGEHTVDRSVTIQVSPPVPSDNGGGSSDWRTYAILALVFAAIIIALVLLGRSRMDGNGRGAS